MAHRPVGGARRARAVRGRARRRSRSTSRWRPASAGAELVHSHTWYANLGGHLAKLVHGIPHVATVHSLEPMRPWKREQLGGGYALSGFAERTALEAADAIIAVSAAHLRRDPHVLSRDRPGADERDLQRDRRRRVPARSRHRRARAPRDRPGAAVGRLRRPDHAPEGARPSARGGARDRPRAPSSSSVPARRTRPRSRVETAARMEAVRERARQRDLDRGDAAEARPDPDPQSRDGVRLPVGLRADGHRQPRGDGLRGRRRRDRGRAASPRSSRTASPGCSSPTRRRPDGTGTPADPAALAAGSRGTGQRAARRSGARRGDGPRGPGAGDRRASAGTSRRRRRWRCTSDCWRGSADLPAPRRDRLAP